MNQVRFQIGVPRAGSAARSAEQEDNFGTNPGRIIRPAAGSAARAAEEEKAAGGRIAQTNAGFSLRGQNGTVTRNAPVTQDAWNRAGAKTAPLEAVAKPDVSASQRVAEPLPSETRGSDSEQSLAGPLQLAASRFQALVRSLFTSGDTTGKS